IGYTVTATKRSPGQFERTRRLQDSFATGRGALMPSPGAKQHGDRTRDKLSLLRSHPLFRDLPPAVIEHLGSYMKTRRVARGTSIFAKGDPGSGLMGVLAGAVKVSVAS